MSKRKNPVPVLAWHFVADKLRDGRPIPRNGVWLKHEGQCGMCVSGLHASRRLIDALAFAPGNTLCRVECVGVVAEQDDKLVCQKRKIIARFDASQLLLRAARKFALDVIHLWPAPEVVVKFLKTGDEALRAAAWAAARAAAEDAPWDAPRDAAGDAAGVAAGAAAGAAAGDAAWIAAWAATRAAAWAAAAAGVAAGAAAGAAAGDAAGDAAWIAAWAAAWDAARAAQNEWLTHEAMQLILEKQP